MSSNNSIIKITLDCEPGGIRPSSLISGVIKDLISNPPDNFENNPQSAKFGEWVWSFEIPQDKYSYIQNEIKERITSLYNNNVIRYGSWE